MRLGPLRLAIGMSPPTTAELVASGRAPEGYSPAAVTLPDSVRPGHLMVSVYGIPVSASGGEWTETRATSLSVFSRVLDAVDLSAPMTIGTSAWAIYRGPSGIIGRAGASAFGTGPTIPGFTKSADSLGLVIGMLGFGQTADPVAAGVATPRQVWRSVESGAPSQRVSIGDVLPPSAYVNGAPLATTASSSGSVVAGVFELIY